MRLKSYSPLLDGQIHDARLTTESSESSYGQPVLMLDDGTALGVADVALADYRILEATQDELTALEKPLPKSDKYRFSVLPTVSAIVCCGTPKPRDVYHLQQRDIDAKYI
jgi:hypothetical protein